MRRKAWKVALIMLCGFDVPIDLATMSCTPSASKIARIGPPAMIPVPDRRGAQLHPAGAEMTGDVVVQGPALAQRHPDHAALGLLRRLADRLRHLTRLAGAVADPAAAVTDDHQRGKAEPATSLHHLGHAIDADQLLDEFALFARALVPRPSRHSVSVLLELEPALAGGIGQRLDAAVVDVGAAVEHDLTDALCCGALGDQLADRLRAASTVAPDFRLSRTSFSSVDAEATVRPA